MYRIVIATAALLGSALSASAGPGDLFAEKVMDFGVSPKGTVLVHYFRFTNNTKQTITVGSPRVSCGCVSATVSSYSIAPGDSAAVVAHMDTRRIATPNVTKSVIVYVPFSGPVAEEVQLRVQTVTRDDLMMSPDVLAFGAVKKGQTAKVSTKVTFLSDPNWEVTDVSSTGGFIKPEFKQDGRNGNFVTYEITATLDKDCPAGNWVSDLYLKTSNPAVAKIRVPVTVNVTAPQVAASPAAVSFGNVSLGSTPEKKIKLESGTPFKILEIKGLDEQLKVVIEQNGASPVHTIVLAANPKEMGGFQRTVEIVTDNKDQPKVIVPVTARVVAK